MKKYKVHLFAVVRVPVKVEAESQTQAIEKAEKETDLEFLFKGCMGAPTEYADEVAYYLVDAQEDEEHQESQWYDYFNGKLRIMPAPEHAKLMLDSLQELSAWMRFHTGPGDKTQEMLTRALTAITAAGEKPRDTWE